MSENDIYLSQPLAEFEHIINWKSELFFLVKKKNNVSINLINE